MVEAAPVSSTWASLSNATRELLTGKLAGLWGAPTDEAAFDRAWNHGRKLPLNEVIELAFGAPLTASRAERPL